MGDCIEEFDDGAETVTMRSHKHRLALGGERRDILQVKWQRPSLAIFHAFAVGWPCEEAAAPQLHLINAVLFCGLGLVKPLKIAVMTFVQRRVLGDRNGAAPERAKNDAKGIARTQKARRECSVERKFLQRTRARGSVFPSLFGQRNVRPSRKAVFEIPLGLAVTKEDESAHE